MNDYISELKKDLLYLLDKLIKQKVIDQSLNKINFSIDYLSKSKQGDISTNLFILLKNNLIDKNYDLKKNIIEEISHFEYIKKVEIARAGFINLFFNDNFIVKNLNKILLQSETYGNNSFVKNNKINI